MSEAVIGNVGLSAAGPTEAQSRKAIYAATIGNVMEWYDYGVYAYLASSLAVNFFPKDDPKSALLSTFAIFGSAWWSVRSAASSSAAWATRMAESPR